MLDLEKQYYSEQVRLIAGVDEAGRGPLAGPVAVAACVLPPDYVNDLINDSKQLTAKKRDALFDEIKTHAIAFSIKLGTPERIDKEDIYHCTQHLMKECLEDIRAHFDLALTDAMPIPNAPFPVIPIIKGDAKAINIAAASILAKVTRDRYMEELEKEYPQFSFATHKGYGTKKHLEELEEHGPIEGVHRKSFAPVKKFFTRQLTLF